MRPIHTRILSVLAASSIMVGCSDSNNAVPQQSITLNFAAQVNDTAFDSTCQTKYSGVGTGAAAAGQDEFKVVDYRMYIHDVHVHDAILGERSVALDNDGTWQYQGSALLDFEDATAGNDCNGTPEMNNQVIGTVDPDVDLSNVQVCFEVGLPFAHNHLDPAASPSPLNVTGMMWVWKNGHKFVRIDGFGDPDNANVAYNLHLGSQGDCQMTAMASPNEAPATQCTVPNTFEACVSGFNVDTDTIVVDIADVYAGNDVSNNAGTKPGCMSFPGDNDCDEIMPRLGLDYSTYGNTGVVSGTPKVQKLISKM